MPQGAIPGAAANPDDTLAGGIILPTFGTATGRIYRFAPIGVTVGTFQLYDRIAHMGGLSGALATGQTVNLAVETPVTAGRALASYANIEWSLEIYTDLGTTACNATVSYTDSANSSGKTIVITGFTGASPLNRVGRVVPLVPTDGIPIKSVQTVTLSISSGTAGSFGVTARVKKCSVGQLLANIQAPGTDAISLGLPLIKDTACLEMLAVCSTTSTGLILGDLLIGSVVE